MGKEHQLRYSSRRKRTKGDMGKEHHRRYGPPKKRGRRRRRRTHHPSPRKQGYNMGKYHQLRPCRPQQKRMKEGYNAGKEHQLRSCPPSIPEEIIFSHILVRLPVQSVLRFKSVCKSWRAIISDPSFIAAHLDHSKKSLKFAILPQHRQCLDEIAMYKYRLDIGNKYANFLFGRIFPQELKVFIYPPAHSNGLVVLNVGEEVLVCNPSTRESGALPRGSPNVFASPYGEQRVGFGFVQGLSAYKVAQYFYRFYDYKTRSYSIGFEVFTVCSSSPSSWRPTEDPPYPICMEYGSVSIGRAIYFRIDNFLHGLSPKLMLSFDLMDEKFTVIPEPCSIEKAEQWIFQEFLGKLCLLVEYSSLFDIWMYEDCKKQTWVRTYTIDFLDPPMIVNLIAERDGKLFFHEGVNGYNRLVRYDVRRKFFRTVADIGGYEFDFCMKKCLPRNYAVASRFQMFNYVESLLPVNLRMHSIIV